MRRGGDRKSNEAKNQTTPSVVSQIADEVGISQTQTYAYASIGKNLIPEWMELFGHKDIDIKKAYALSQLDTDIQLEIYYFLFHSRFSII